MCRPRMVGWIRSYASILLDNEHRVLDEATDGGSPTESGILLMLQPATNGAVAVVSQEIRARSLVKRCRVLDRLRVPSEQVRRRLCPHAASGCALPPAFPERQEVASQWRAALRAPASRARVAARPAYLNRVTRGIAA